MLINILADVFGLTLKYVWRRGSLPHPWNTSSLLGAPNCSKGPHFDPHLRTHLPSVECGMWRRKFVSPASEKPEMCFRYF